MRFHSEVTAVGWVSVQLRASWAREGEPPERGLGQARPIIVLCGLVALVLLAVAAVTIVNLDGLWQWHEAAGFALLPVLALKLVPVGIRAAAYYTTPAFARLRLPLRLASITPPVLAARLTAPPLVVATGLLLASGVVMWHGGDQRSAWATVHNASAIGGSALLAVHLACHARSTLAVGVRSLVAPGQRVTGGRVSPFVVAASLVAGIILAVFTVPGASWHQGRPDRLRTPQGTVQTSASAGGHPSPPEISSSPSPP